MSAVITLPASHYSAASVAPLKEWGFLTSGGDRIGVTREGLLQIDRLLHEFFKPNHNTGHHA
ncbi:MAG: hypothetical protein MUF81_05640 [Verrucomicrobia bacterium]|jgi:oxygen-independent coproporphyrinogen-3 oxidase|nr:hypothetical protein [Verrucomicrobiota bacterium]